MLKNTLSDHKDIRLATWTGTGDRNSNQINLLVMHSAQAKAMLNCRVHRGAEHKTDHFLLVGFCRLQLRQPHASQSKLRSGYDSGCLHDAAVQRKYADMTTDTSHHLHSMVGMPDSTPKTLRQQCTSGLQRCAERHSLAHHGCPTRPGPACKVSKTPTRP